MSLIEGIGDEVTIVFGFLLVAVIILLAWFSTHTDDLSLFREMGVIVVELSQRRTTNRDTRTEDSTAELPGSEGTPTGPLQEASSGAPAPSSDIPESPHGESSAAASSTDASLNVTGESSNQSDLAEVASASKAFQTQCANKSITGQGLFHCEGEEEKDRVASEANLLEEEVVIKDSGDSSNSISQMPLDGEEIRQRRVQYFQREGGQDCEESSLHNSHACSSAGIPQQVSKSGGACGVSSDTNSQHLTHSSNDNNRLSNQPNISEDLPASPSPNEITDSDLSQENSQQSDSQIRVRLRYMNETQRCVFAKPNDTIGDFRRTHFQTELEDNKWVRFIFNGQDLRDDARTLQACNIVNNSTMHCLVTSHTRTQPQHDAAGDEEDDSMLGTLMYPLFTILLAIVWYFRFTYRQYFSAMSTVCLIGISFILVLSYFSSFRMSDSQHVQEAPPAAQTTPTGSNSRSRDSNSD